MAGGFGDTFENDILKLIFQAVAITGIADNASSGAITSLYVGLHTADPGETGVQTTSEATYTGYARVGVLRNGTVWTVSGNVASPASNITFGQCTAGSEVLTHFSIGTASTGGGKIIVFGNLSSSIAMSSGVTPIINTSSTITLD